MKRSKSSLLMALCMVALSMQSCKEEDTCIAGTGGDVSLVLFPQHHGEAIPGVVGYVDSAFIKFNTRDFPGDDPSKYDLVLTGDVGSDSILVENLKCGDYYIYMTGKDSSDSVSYRVNGGIPYFIRESDAGIYNVIVPVTED